MNEPLVQLAGDDARELARALQGCDRQARLVEWQRFDLAARFADCYGYTPSGEEEPNLSGERVRPTADGCPGVGEFAPLELGAALGIGPERAWELIETALLLRHRFPILWREMRAGEVWAWQAAKVARWSRELPLGAARKLDAEVTAIITRVQFSRVRKLVEGRVAQHLGVPEVAGRFVKIYQVGTTAAEVFASLNPADGMRLERSIAAVAQVLRQGGHAGGLDERRAAALGVLANPALALKLQEDTLFPLDPDDTTSQTETEVDGADVEPRCAEQIRRIPVERLYPQTELVIHLSEDTLDKWARPKAKRGGIARCEQLGPLLKEQLAEIVGHDRITVRPVVIPLELEPADAYEARPQLKFGIRTLHTVESFPFGRTRSRRCDLDHVIPYQRGGPPGQTRPDNLQPLGRRAHRAKTYAGWAVTAMPNCPSGWVWTSPLGFIYTVTPDGTTLIHEPSDYDLKRTIAAT